MHLVVNTEGGGIGSCLTIMLRSIVEELSVGEIKTINSLEVKYPNAQKALSNIMDYFEPRQINSDAVKSIERERSLSGGPALGGFGDLNSDNFLPLYKSILKKLKFKKTLLDRVPKGISKFLGVHIRLTDFNFYHGGQYGHLTLGDYVTCVKKILKDGNYDGLFVSSDNAESIPNMEQHFPDIDIVYNESKNCWCDNEGNGLGIEGRRQKRSCFGSADFIVESFVDMVSLSRCKSIVIRQKTGFGALAHLWSTHNQGLYYVE
tara:strand:- start:631 stop:1416 length:786 start_codon:yes stop_codon:yes gene_type:complete